MCRNIYNQQWHQQKDISTGNGKTCDPQNNKKNVDATRTAEPKTDDVFIAFLAADTDSTVYTDLTGKFPVTSRLGNKYVMVLYHYDSNGVILRPMKNRSDDEALRVYADMYEFLEARNCKPKLNIMDNFVLLKTHTYRRIPAELRRHCGFSSAVI